MAMTLSVKMVGLFIVAAVGLATIFDLWSLMDVRRGLELVRYDLLCAARWFLFLRLPFCLTRFHFVRLMLRNIFMLVQLP